MWLIVYIDPGTGSYVLQVVAAGVLGAMFALKMFWHRIAGFFRRDRPSKPDVEQGGKSSD